MNLKELRDEIKRIKIDSDNFIENSNYGDVDECSKEIQRISKLEGIKQTVKAVDKIMPFGMGSDNYRLWKEIKKLLKCHQ